MSAETALYLPITLPAEFPILRGFPPCLRHRVINHFHAHDCFEIACCLQGEGTLVGAKTSHFQSGDLLVMSPFGGHSVRTTMPNTQWIWLYFDPVRLLKSFLPATDVLEIEKVSGSQQCYVISPETDCLAPSLAHLIDKELRCRPFDFHSCVASLVWNLMVRLQRLSPERCSKPVVDPVLQRLAPALDLMAKTFSQKTDIVKYARECKLSASHFRRLFFDTIGKSPHSYLTELKVAYAAEQLKRREAKIITIAMDAGFSTLSSFNRAFQRIMGTTPKAWREQN